MGAGLVVLGSSAPVESPDNNRNTGGPGFLCQHKFQSQQIQEFLTEDQPEQNYSRNDEKSDIPQVAWFDEVGLHELHDDEETDKPEDKEEPEIDPLGKKHEHGYDGEPESKGDCGDQFLSHTRS